jgi:ketosteroid isomerase-like protein
MKSLFLLFFLLYLQPGLAQQTDPPDEVLLENLLHEFLEGASENDFEVHYNFWADDLIYTSATGERITKADILNGLSVSDEPDENRAAYSAEDIRINVYGETAVVAFRLIAEVPLNSGKTELMEFHNTGTFLKRDGKWQAVAWQATQIQ